VDDEQTKESEHGDSARGTALKAAAAAAATGAAAFAVKKVMSGGNGSSESSNGKERGRSGGTSNSMIASVASGGWDAARDALVPLAEDAAAAAGKYLAESSPEIVRERIVPRFIASFNETSGND
jgi:hypothetical protein